MGVRSGMTKFCVGPQVQVLGKVQKTVASTDFSEHEVQADFGGIFVLKQEGEGGTR